ncbi:hypothetical protein pdam_00022167 [Pocillopora damicornis]|uniref:Uncharacterized protein n=1 Tax=Pocillopora damicornis TaxID=46731 RepID=A0A3M6UEN9_POCDA|nr:hypothetical protein pdam_00022167 [Pocillopora damicornis]
MAHRLNLSDVSACKMQNARSFEYSPKKEALLVQKLKDVCPESRRHKLLDVCRTRWIQCIDGLEVFLMPSLQHWKPSKQMQKSAGQLSDIRDAVETLSSERQKVEEKHAKWFQKACQIAEKLGITVQKPRTCQVQRNRANTPAETI